MTRVANPYHNVAVRQINYKRLQNRSAAFERETNTLQERKLCVCVNAWLRWS